MDVPAVLRRDRVEVGNAYVNRAITGAVVRRQPFGGWKRSSVGPGAKAGGPNYLFQFLRPTDDVDVDRDDLATVAASYRAAWAGEFTADHDPSGLRSESNVLRYRPVRRVVVRHAGDHDALLERLRAASTVTGVELVESCGSELSDDAFVAALHPDDRVRFLGAPTAELRRALVEREIWFDTGRPAADGRIELLKWVREQAVSRTLHRHGRLP